MTSERASELSSSLENKFSVYAVEGDGERGRVERGRVGRRLVERRLVEKGMVGRGMFGRGMVGRVGADGTDPREAGGVSKLISSYGPSSISESTLSFS